MNAGIAIIMPLFNKAAYVAQALEALRPQMHEHDEIIVVDDCSTDNGPAIAANALAAVENARVLHLQRNDGPATARNIGARMTTAPHLFFFDADDLPAPNLLQSLREAIARHPDESILRSPSRFRRGVTASALRVLPAPQSSLMLAASMHSWKTVWRAVRCAQHPAFAWPDPLSKRPPDSRGLRYCEDPELWARLSSQHAVIEIRDTLALYRDVPQSLSYGLRTRIGAVNPYVDTLGKLAALHGDSYRQLACSLLLKNLVFARAAGADIAAIQQQLGRYRSLLGPWRHAALRVLGRLPAGFYRSLLELRAARARAAAGGPAA